MLTPEDRHTMMLGDFERALENEPPEVQQRMIEDYERQMAHYQRRIEDAAERMEIMNQFHKDVAEARYRLWTPWWLKLWHVVQRGYSRSAREGAAKRAAAEAEYRRVDDEYWAKRLAPNGD